MTDQDVLLIDRRGPIVVVTMNRPERRNALNAVLRDSLTSAFADFEADDSLHVAILTGAGTAFCAGADLHEMSSARMGPPPSAYQAKLGKNARAAKPVIAAVNGPAYAGGFQLVQSCHLCVASERAAFAITEARVGRGSPWAASLGAMLPERIIAELLTTGLPMPADRAYQLGFANRLVPPDQLVPSALELAMAIAANAPLTVRAGLQLVHAIANMGSDAALHSGTAIYRHVYESEDAIEGPRAFAEKRSPRWKGR